MLGRGRGPGASTALPTWAAMSSWKRRSASSGSRPAATASAMDWMAPASPSRASGVMRAQACTTTGPSMATRACISSDGLSPSGSVGRRLPPGKDPSWIRARIWSAVCW